MPRAARSRRQLDATVRKAVAQVIDSVDVDPRPAGATLLVGYRPYMRVRSGDYRIIYAVDDEAHVVTVAVIGHRRDIYL